MPTLLWQRDIYGVQNTFSSWDACMSESYCKWPAIIGIVVGSLILISVVWCCARCLCCGLECCCGCLSCFNRCCPSPRQKNAGYEKPQSYPYKQYQSPAPPMYFGGHHSPQTATFDSPSKNYHADSLPAMPTWSHAPSRQVEDDSVEMEKLDHHPSIQQQGLLHQRHDSEESFERDGDIGRMPASPYHEQPNVYHAQTNAYQQQSDAYQQQSNAYQQQSTAYQPYSSGYQTQSHVGYENANSYQAPTNSYPQQTPYGQMSPYEEEEAPYHDYSQHQQYAGSPTYNRPPSSVYTAPYAAPPSYRTAPPSVASPIQQHAPTNYGMGRQPVTGSWRDV